MWLGKLTEPPCGRVGRELRAWGEDRFQAGPGKGENMQRMLEDVRGKVPEEGPRGHNRRTHRGGNSGAVEPTRTGGMSGVYGESSRVATCPRQVTSSLGILLGTLEKSGERLCPDTLVPGQEALRPLGGAQRR